MNTYLKALRLVLNTGILLFLATCPARLFATGSEKERIMKLLRKQFLFSEPLVTEHDKFCERNPDPGFVMADFNGDGKADVAILLRDMNAKSLKRHFIIFFQDGPLKYRKILEEFFDPPKTAWPQEILDLKPHKLWTGQGSPEINMKSHGIEMVKCEAWTWIYYWNSKSEKIETLIAGD